MTPALTVIDPAGEVVRAVDAAALLAAAGITSIAAADTVSLAAFTADADDLRSIASEAKGLVGDELVRRLDRSGAWTRRDGAFTITAPSPAAGTVAYDTDRLRETLADLVTGGTIDAGAANAALEVFRAAAQVPFSLLAEMACALRGELDPTDVDAVLRRVDELLAFRPDPTYRPRLAGINALLKLPAAREAVEACRVSVTPPRRVAKVRRTA